MLCAGIWNYIGSTNATYVLNTQLAKQSVAEQFCRDRGGHLASYASFQEQIEVEQWFVEQGFLLPDYHR